MLKDQLTLVINSCEKFSDLWDAHITLLNQNWPDRGVDTLLVTDAPRTDTYPGVRLLCAGEGKELSERIGFMLENIRTEYVLITLDDYMPIYPIDTAKIQRLVDAMEKEKLDYLRLFHHPWAKEKLPGWDGLYKVDLWADNYAVNLYVGIWRKDFLKQTVRQKLNAWQYEVSLTGVAREVSARCAMSKGKEFPIMDTVRKGKLLHKANRYFKKHPIYKGNRPVGRRRDEIFITVRTLIREATPKGFLNFLKKIGRKLGMKFYSD